MSLKNHTVFPLLVSVTVRKFQFQKFNLCQYYGIEKDRNGEECFRCHIFAVIRNVLSDYGE